MDFLSGKNLADTLRNACDSAKRRFWVASPYIGGWSEVRRIIGRKSILRVNQRSRIPLHRCAFDCHASYRDNVDLSPSRNQSHEPRSVPSRDSLLKVRVKRCKTGL